MKYLIIVFILFFLIKTVHAQIIETPNNGGMIDNIKTVKPQSLQGSFPQAKLLYNTDKGKVFALPLDKMPCLVPNIISNMPIAILDLKEYKKIPNSIPEQKVIPEVEVPNKGLIHRLNK